MELSLQQRAWQWFVEHAQRPHALGWLGLVAFADAIFFPIPPEIFLVALTLAHRDRWKQYLFTSVISSAAGAVVGYFLATFLFHQFGEPILAFYHLESAFETARRLIEGHVFLAMMVASFTPIPDKVYIYAGGFLLAPFLPYMGGYVLGRAVRMALTVYLTHRFGIEALEIIKKYLRLFGLLLFALLVAYAIVHWHLLF